MEGQKRQTGSGQTCRTRRRRAPVAVAGCATEQISWGSVMPHGSSSRLVGQTVARRAILAKRVELGVPRSCRVHAAHVRVLTEAGREQRRRGAWNVREREVAPAQRWVVGVQVSLGFFGKGGVTFHTSVTGRLLPSGKFSQMRQSCR